MRCGLLATGGCHVTGNDHERRKEMTNKLQQLQLKMKSESNRPVWLHNYLLSLLLICLFETDIGEHIFLFSVSDSFDVFEI